MTATIHITGEIGKETTLLGVIRQFKSFENPKEVEVIINSNGGEVSEGQDIYLYLRGLGLPITTKASRAYSIAASIFMAGDIRLLEDGNNRFMIHLPLAEVRGGRKMLEKVQARLEEIENEFTEFYSKYTSIAEDTIRRLLENETYLSADEAVELGIATGTYQEFKAVAHFKEEIKEKDNKMTKTEKLIKAFSDFLGNTEKEGSEEITIKAELILQDATGAEVKFPELQENEEPEVGAKVEGEDRTILMPDGNKIVVEGGVVKELIDAPEDEVEQEQEPVAEPEAKEDEVDFSAMLQKFEDSIIEKIKAENKVEKEALEAQITALKKEVGSEIENEPVITNKKSNSGSFLTNALRNKQNR